MKLNTFKPNSKVAGPVKSLLLTAIIASATLTAVLPAAADHRSGRSYMGGGAGQFEDMMRTYVEPGARSAADRARKIFEKGKVLGGAANSLRGGATSLMTGRPFLPFIILPDGYEPGAPLKQ